MENIKNPKNPDDYSDRISKTSHQNIDTSLSRSYICSFCIRGFSNAQALGGHMNIHRRDRAKLREKLMEDNKDDVVAEKSKLDTSDHGKVMEVSIDGSSSSHHREIEGLDLELRLGQRAVEKKKT
ncbi:unnamed protein product [Arabis nemorensis]|uniref:C2H2-type domain-containing protein n=1 Tax=Arabis nemorensis TaxID=586526 RepID=A0A565B6L8_9BRAS|nr:unnamed protein product [Arabis nemorensis]